MFFGLPDEINDDVAYFRFSSETMNNEIDHADLYVHVNRPSTLASNAAVVLHLKMEICTVDNLEGKVRSFRHFSLIPDVSGISPKSLHVISDHLDTQ